MIKQAFAFRLMVNEPEKTKTFDEIILPIIKTTLLKLDMSTVEKFAASELMFIGVLHEVFRERFGSRFTSFGGRHHPALAQLGPRYDLGLRLGTSDDGIFPMQLEFVEEPETKPTLH